VCWIVWHLAVRLHFAINSPLPLTVPHSTSLHDDAGEAVSCTGKVPVWYFQNDVLVYSIERSRVWCDEVPWSICLIAFGYLICLTIDQLTTKMVILWWDEKLSVEPFVHSELLLLRWTCKHVKIKSIVTYFNCNSCLKASSLTSLEDFFLFYTPLKRPI
jgi:hypothetical protein